MKPRELIAALQLFPEDLEIVVSTEWVSSLHQGFVEPPVHDYKHEKTRHRLAYRATESYGKGERVVYFFSESQRTDWLQWRPQQTSSVICKADPEEPVSVYYLD